MILKGISVNQDPPTKDYLWITPKGNTRFWNQSTWMLIGGSGDSLPVIESSGKYLVTTGTQGNFSLAWSDIDLSNYISGTVGYAAVFNGNNSITNAVDRIRVGDGIIEWDSTNGGFKIYNANSTFGNPVAAGIYAGWVSALGANSSGGGGGGGGDLDWSALVYWDEEPEHIINKNYLPYNLEYITSHPYYAVEEDSNGKLYVNVNWHDTTYNAGTGLTLSGFTLNHSNSISQGNFGLSSNTTANSITLPYVSYDGQGHISAVSSNTFTIGNLDAATVFSFNTKIPFNNLPNLYVGYTKISGSTNGNTQLKGISKITHATTNNDTSTAAIEWDQTNNAWHFYGGIYSDSFVSALGVNSSGGGSGDINYADLWQELASSSSEHYAGSTIINSTHLPLGYTQNNKNYPVQANNNKLYVNVPWTDHYNWSDITNKPFISIGSNLSVSGGVLSGNPGTVTSVRVAATSPVQSSSSSSQTSTLNTTISLADGYGDIKNPYNSKTKNTFLAAPKSSNGVPSFREIEIEDLNNLEIGGRNLLANSDKDKAESHETYNVVEFNFTQSLIEGMQYILTAKVTTTSDKKTIRFYHSGGVTGITPWLVVTEDGQYKYTFTATSYMASQTSGNGYGFCRVYISNNESGGNTPLTGTAHVDWIKIERGNKQTDWTPAPEDLLHISGGIMEGDIEVKTNNVYDLGKSDKKWNNVYTNKIQIGDGVIEWANGGLHVYHKTNGNTAGLYADWISALGANSGGGSGGGGINWADFWNELNYTETHEYSGTKIIDRRYLPINGLAANSGGQTFYAPTNIGSSGQYLRWPSSGNTPYWDTLDVSDIPNLSASKINSGTFDVDRIPTLSITDKTSGTLPVGRGGTGSTTLTSGYLLTGNGTSTIQAYQPSWQAWTAGTTTGPKAKIKLGNVDYESSAIPTATNLVSGVVTTGNQTFAGRKTMNLVNPHIYDGNSNSSRYKRLYFNNNSDTLVGQLTYDSGNTTNVTSGQFLFDEYSPNSTASTITTGYYERYRLPVVNSELSTNAIYDILTTKDLSFSITGNAATATILQTTRTINGTNFNGSANITTSTWGTARNISISDADGTNTGDAVSVNGSENKTLKLPSTIKASLNGTVNGYSIASTINGGTANRLAYYTSSGIDDASTIYASNTKLAINSTSEPSYNFYVDGTSCFTNDLYLNNTKRIYLGNNASTTVYQDVMRLDSSNNFIIGNGTSASSYNTYLDGFKIYLRTNTTHSTRLYIDESGNVGIGTTTPPVKLSVNGDIYASGGITALQSVSSDKRLKKNIKKFNAKDIIDKLNPVSFEWNSKAKKLSDFKDGINYGLIAQDSDGIIDNLVFDLPNGKGYKGVRYEKLIPILLQAIKEQQKEIDELKQIIKKLKV